LHATPLSLSGILNADVTCRINGPIEADHINGRLCAHAAATLAHVSIPAKSPG
jgi:hypothetical protein